MTVRFDLSTRAALDKLAEATGFVYDNGKPRLAELVRVLLISSVYAKDPVASRTAYALYSNGIMSISKHLTLMLMSLRDDIAVMAQRITKSKDTTEPPPPDPDRLNAECGICTNVFLILDDWTHDGLKDLLIQMRMKTDSQGLPDSRFVEYRKPHGDMMLVRDIVGAALQEIETHLPVINKYVGTIKRIEDTVSKVVADERIALSAAIAEVKSGG